MDLVRDKRNFRMRQFVLKIMDAWLLNGAVARWSYCLGLHGKLRVTEYMVNLDSGKPLDQPLVIAFASDFHAGPMTHPALFDALIDQTIRRQPDVVLLGGDFVSSRAKDVDIVAQRFARLKPPLGVFAVLGNHDWWTDDQTIMKSVEGAGVQLLVNSNRSLPAPFQSVSICGFDDPWTGNADPARTFADAGPIRIFLTHSPDGLLLLKQHHHFDVAFAGHTHGGQIALPDGTQIVTAGGPLSRNYGRGRFELTGNGPLIVSRGVGCSNLPIRINADPELIICTMISQT